MFDKIQIGDKVSIYPKFAKGVVIPKIGTVIDGFWGRENYHNGDTSWCLEAVTSDGNSYSDEYDYYFYKFDGDYNALLQSNIKDYEEKIQRIKTKAQEDIAKEEANIRALKQAMI